MQKRLIDATDALARLEKAEQEMKVVSIVGYKAVPMDGVIEFIKTRPTIDAVEVVRCRDCKHYVVRACACRHENFNGIIRSDGFCSYGEKENNL